MNIKTTLLTLAAVSISGQVAFAQNYRSYSGLNLPAGPTCSQLTSGVVGSSASRCAETNTSQNGTMVKTSPSREAKMDDYKKEAYRTTKSGATDFMGYWPAAGVKWKLISDTQGYGTGTVPKISVTGLAGKNGVLDMTLGLPVSGHVGWDNAQKWSKTDNYNVGLLDGGKETPLVFAKSLDITTFQEVHVPLEAGKTMRLVYWRDGSAGVYGYIEARVLEITWDGN